MMYGGTCITMGTNKRLSVAMLEEIPELKPLKPTGKSFMYHRGYYTT